MNAQPQSDPPQRKRVFLVDDHPMVRERLALLIDQQEDMHVVGEAGDAQEAIQAIEQSRPDVAIIDLSLRTTSGLDLIKDLKARGCHTPLLVLSMHEEELYAERVLKAGAMGYLSKQESTRVILDAIRQVLDGGIHVSPALAGRLVKRMVAGGPKQALPDVGKLADRELEVFQLIGKGHGTRKIAEILSLSVKTVESYRARIKEKLGIEDGVQLMQRAVQWTGNYHGKGPG